MTSRRKRSIAWFLTIFLDVMFYGLIAVLALALIVVMSGATVTVQLGPNGAPAIVSGSNIFMSIPVRFSLDPDAQHIVAPSLGIDRADIHDAMGSLRFAPGRGAFFIGNVILVFGALSLAVWVIAQLRALLRTVRDGQPFVPANAARVRRIGWAVILGELLRAAVVFFESSYAMTHFSADGLRFIARPDVNLLVVVHGLIILVIAEVFRAGTRLDEEQSLTV